jgi:hypothetical protein
MGDTLMVRRGASVRFVATVNGVNGGEVAVILDGQRVPLLKEPRIGSMAQSCGIKLRGDGKPQMLPNDVREEAGHLMLVGNPIYLQAR